MQTNTLVKHELSEWIFQYLYYTKSLQDTVLYGKIWLYSDFITHLMGDLKCCSSLYFTLNSRFNKLNLLLR